MAGFDIISDLGWGAPFDCLKNGEVHEWVIRFYIKAPVTWVTCADPSMFEFADYYPGNHASFATNGVSLS